MSASDDEAVLWEETARDLKNDSRSDDLSLSSSLESERATGASSRKRRRKGSSQAKRAKKTDVVTWDQAVFSEDENEPGIQMSDSGLDEPTTNFNSATCPMCTYGDSGKSASTSATLKEIYDMENLYMLEVTEAQLAKMQAKAFNEKIYDFQKNNPDPKRRPQRWTPEMVLYHKRFHQLNPKMLIKTDIETMVRMQSFIRKYGFVKRKVINGEPTQFKTWNPVAFREWRNLSRFKVQLLSKLMEMCRRENIGTRGGPSSQNDKPFLSGRQEVGGFADYTTS